MRVSSPLIVGGVQYAPGQGYLGSGGKTYFLNTVTGNDGADGDAEHPLLTLEEAYDRLVDKSGDTIVFQNNGYGTTAGGGKITLATAFDWAKNNCHFIGDCAPTHVGQRCRITGTDSTGIASLFTVSGQGNYFGNFSIFDEYTVNPIALTVTGDRNVFENVNIQGMGAATGADDAAAASLYLNGAYENEFRRCAIGLATVPRSAANAEIRFAGASSRNLFDRCEIISYCDAAGHFWVDVGSAGAIDRDNEFMDCRFKNSTKAGSTAMTAGIKTHASSGGEIWLTGNTSMFGATDWIDANNGIVIYKGTAATAGSDGIMLAITTS